jgi:molybdate-binding protein/DNA-binding XRE family transcriptional regulator
MSSRRDKLADMAERLETSLRRARVGRGLSQEGLAALAGISRQALGALEAGRSVPSTAVSLRLARALRSTVEELFSLAEGSLLAWLAPAPVRGGEGAREGGGPRGGEGRRSGPGSRVVLAEIGDRLVAHELSVSARGPGALFAPADGIASRGRRPQAQVRVQPLRPRDALRENVLAAGCDPALSLLAARLSDRAPQARLCWLQAGSLAALQMLADGNVHLAGTHLRDGETGEFNLPAVRALFPGRSMLVVGLARWEQGLAVARGNPRGLRRADDLARRGVRMVNREPGAGARALLDGLLRRAGVSARDVEGYGRLAAGHLEVAQAVASGGADAGVCTRAAAQAYGLSFVPLAEERFDLVLLRESAEDPRIARLLATLRSHQLRRELGALPGYSAARAGDPVAELGPLGAGR